MKIFTVLFYKYARYLIDFKRNFKYDTTPGPGRHLVQQSSESDLRRRSTASLAASITHLATLPGKKQ